MLCNKTKKNPKANVQSKASTASLKIPLAKAL